jgi:hypothetical protein
VTRLEPVDAMFDSCRGVRFYFSQTLPGWRLNLVSQAEFNPTISNLITQSFSLFNTSGQSLDGAS